MVQARMPTENCITKWLIDSVAVANFVPAAPICIGVTSSTAVGDRPVPSGLERDLPDSLRRRLSAGLRTLHPGSACSVVQRDRMPTIETATSRPAASVSVGAPRLSSADRAVIGIEWRRDGLAAGGYRCEAERRNGVWVVVGCKRTWVS